MQDCGHAYVVVTVRKFTLTITLWFHLFVVTSSVLIVPCLFFDLSQ